MTKYDNSDRCGLTCCDITSKIRKQVCTVSKQNNKVHKKKHVFTQVVHKSVSDVKTKQNSYTREFGHKWKIFMILIEGKPYYYIH